MSNRLFQVSSNSLWGIINSENKVIIPIIYDYVFPPINRYCVIKQKDRYGLIDMNGDIIVKVEYNTYNDVIKLFSDLSK